MPKHITAIERLAKLREALADQYEAAASRRSNAENERADWPLRALEVAVETDDGFALVKREAREAAVEITSQERATIITVAKKLPSRRQVAKTLFGSAGGKAYKKVKQVCDEAGLLLGESDLTVLEA